MKKLILEYDGSNRMVINQNNIVSYSGSSLLTINLVSRGNPILIRMEEKDLEIFDEHIFKHDMLLKIAKGKPNEVEKCYLCKLIV